MPKLAPQAGNRRIQKLRSAPSRAGVGPLLARVVRLFHQTSATLSKKKPVVRMSVIEQISLGGKRSLTIVAIDGDEYLIGGNADNVSNITPLLSRTGDRIRLAGER